MGQRLSVESAEEEDTRLSSSSHSLPPVPVTVKPPAGESDDANKRKRTDSMNVRDSEEEEKKEEEQDEKEGDRPSGLLDAFTRSSSASAIMSKLFSSKRPSLPNTGLTTETDAAGSTESAAAPAASPQPNLQDDDPFAEENFIGSPHSSSSRASSVVMSPRTFEQLDAEFKPPTLSRYRSEVGGALSRTNSKAVIARLTSKNISDSDSDYSLDSDSSSDDDIVQSDEIEVNDWLDEPEDAVFSPKPQHTRHSSFSSSTSTLHGAHSSNSLTGAGPGGGRPSSITSSSNSITALATWLSSPEDPDDEIEDDYEPVLTQFMKDNMPVYEVMKQVQLFRNLSQNQQEQVVRALKPTKFQNGEIIVQQGTRGSRFYMIAKGNAVITKTTKGPNGQEQERMITHLHAGHYFGELALIYDDPRTATVRAVGDVELLYLTQEDFQRIGQVHLSLMLQQVPLLAKLNAHDQDVVLSRLKPANFNDGEYIVCQGEEGTRFYMITRGEAVVTERATTSVTNADGTVTTKQYEKELTRLYEGHVFGEMSLIYSEPRTASVRAIGPVKCLYLSKEDFDKCLLSDPFQRFIQEAYVEKATRRAMRLRLQQRASSTGKDGGATPTAGNPNTPTVIPPPAPSSPAKATETRKLVKQRLKNGQKVVNKYIIKGDLGKGTFGRVKLCQNEEDGKLYAVKIMHKTFVQRMAGKEDQFQDVLRREVAIMKKLNHRNVVKLVEVIDDPSSEKMYLVQEYVQHNLMDEVTRNNGLGEAVARKYMRDLLSGLHYLHFHKVIHRDIKPENILVSAEGVAKIADFGTARMIMNESETLSGAKGTPAFMAPEMFNIDATYTGPSVDVWSLGATLYMMVIGRPPWLADNEIVLAEKVQRDELKFPKEHERTMEPHLKNLIQRMLTKDPSLRLTLNDCFNHDWITKEGSEPLGLVTQENDLTVSLDESERAIQNIPERIDQSLSDSLARAHLLVKGRQQGSGVVRTSSGHSLGLGTPVSSQLENRIPTATSMTSTTSSTSPNRSSTEEVARVINAWRNHKRLHLMDGHKELSARSRELLLEQKRMAFSVDRAKVTEIILPAAGPTARSRYPSSSSVNPQFSTTSSNSSGGSTPGSPRHQSSPSVFVSSRSNSVESNPLLKKRSSSRIDPDSGGHTLEGFGRTSFTSISRLSDLLKAQEDGDNGERGSFSSGGDAAPETTDLDLMKRSLSRKKDFLMVTSEVFRDEEGDYQTRKILFQARDHDFSVASRVPTHTKSGRELGRPPSSQARSSRKSVGSSPFNNNSGGSLGSSASGSKKSKSSSMDEFDMDDLDCVQVTEVDDDEDEEEEDRHEEVHDDHDHSSSSDDGSDYSDVEADVDVDATFSDLIGTPNHIELVDDEEIAPLDPPSRGSSASNLLDFQKQSVVQVYVSSKIRENLKLRIRSGYGEAKGSRSYMEDKSTGITECNLSTYDPAVAAAYESLGFFGVYDGHNGDDTAVWLQKELHRRCLSHPAFLTSPVTAIAEICDSFDHDILEFQNSKMLPKRKRTMMNDDFDVEEVEEICDDNDMECHLQPISFSGAVSVFTVLAKRKKLRTDEAAASATDGEEENKEAEDDEPTMLYIANVGDCRAVLCTDDGVAVEHLRTRCGA
uniref:cGMP-dependent protein kinase n=1 Tax=Globisporangium ultimum (strain ATCC 200006 / CBS 805.95 / DAOM BR144) TaxID=431595 RepID=K3WAW8_GLOUD